MALVSMKGAKGLARWREGSMLPPLADAGNVPISDREGIEGAGRRGCVFVAWAVLVAPNT